MSIMKDKLLETLQNGPLTPYEIAEKLNLDDTFKVMAMITELEHFDKKVHLAEMKPCYEPDGSQFFIAKYGLVKE